MEALDPLNLGIIALVSVAAGAINTVVGSGSLITFPTLLAMGLPPVTANMANTAGLAIGNVGGIIGYRRELRGQWRLLLPLAILTAFGAFFGALALLALPAAVFHAVAPVLVVVGCVLVGIQPLLQRRAALPHGAVAPTWLRYPLTLFTGAYGGYFGAAQGVLIVGILELTTDAHLQRVNAFKNVLQTLAGWVATIVFVFSAPLPWPTIAALAVGSLAGAALGGIFGRKLPSWALRTLIIVIGAVAVVFLLQ